MNQRVRVSLGLLLALVSATACSSSSGTPAGVTTQTIDTKGGTVESAEGAKLVVPPNGVSEAVAVSVSALTASDVKTVLPSDVALAGQPVAFTPYGTEFAVPATISIPASVGANLVLSLDDASSTTWREVPGVQFSANLATFQTTHLRLFAACKRSPTGGTGGSSSSGQSSGGVFGLGGANTGGSSGTAGAISGSGGATASGGTSSTGDSTGQGGTGQGGTSKGGSGGSLATGGSHVSAGTSAVAGSTSGGGRAGAAGAATSGGTLAGGAAGTAGTASAVCAVSDVMTSCQICLAQKCCAQQSACKTESICSAFYTCIAVNRYSYSACISDMGTPSASVTSLYQCAATQCANACGMATAV